MKLLVVVGSYERILYGVDVEIVENSELVKVTNSFAMPAHTGSIKTVASCPRFLVSGGTDETIRIFDLKKRKDVGSLSQHDGSVNALAWAGSTHLLTGGEDGRVALFRSKDWECLHVLRHKKPITGLAIHPSGKLAISIGKNRSLRLWNLMTGKQAHRSKTSQESLRIEFSQSGKYYAILSDYFLQVYASEGGERPLLEFKSATRLAAMIFLGDDTVCVGGEGSKIQQIDIIKSEGSTVCMKLFDTQLSPRIKGLAMVSSPKHGDILVAASSAGVIAGWKLSSTGDHEDSHHLLFTHNSGIRITCLTATLDIN